MLSFFRNYDAVKRERMVVGGGFEPPNSKRADLQSAAFDRSAIPPTSGAGEGNRTLLASLEGWNITTMLRPHFKIASLKDSVAPKFVKE